MIIEGGSRSAGWWWSRHLQSAENNERVELMGIVGLTADNIPDAFREMYAMARGSKATNYFYQYNIDPRKDERLTDAQWREAHDTLRHNLGHADQPYFRVRHTKADGSIHEHGISFRIDLERGTAISDSLTAQIHERTSRELEIKFELQRGRSILVPDRDFERPPRRAKKWERFRGAQNGIDPHSLDAELTAIKQRSDNGQSFKAGLEASGLSLARGDRRDFVVIDRAGKEHSLARRLGVKVADVRAFMRDIDPASVPGVAEAKARQQARESAREARQRGKHGGAVKTPAEATARTTEPPRGQEAPRKDEPEKSASKRQTTAGNMRGAWTAANDAGDLIAALAARNIGLARVSADEARASSEQAQLYRQQKRQQATARGRYAAMQPEPLRYAPVLKEGEIVAVDGRGHMYRFDKRTTGAERGEIDKRLAGIDAGFLLSIGGTKKTMREASRAASRAAWIEQREKARPASGIERAILDCEDRARIAGATIQRDREGATVSGAQALADRLRPDGERETTTATIFGAEAFAARLDQAGIAIVRATDADVKIIDALRREEAAARLAAETNRQAYKGSRFDKLEAGEVAAVNRRGDVFRLNPHRLDLERIERALTSSKILPGVIEACAAFESNRAQTEKLWTQTKAASVARKAAFEQRRALRGTVATAERTVHAAFEKPVAAAGKAFGTGLSLTGIAARTFATLFSILSFGAMAGPKQTAQQRRDEAQAAGNVENRHARNVAADQQAKEVAADWQQFEQNRARQYDDLMHGRLGQSTPATPRENQRGDDDERERERGRD